MFFFCSQKCDNSSDSAICPQNEADKKAEEEIFRLKLGECLVCGLVIWMATTSGATHALFPYTLKSKLARVARRPEIIFFSFFHHSVFLTYFLCSLSFSIPLFSLQFTISLSLRIFWGITLSSLSSTHPFFFCLGSQRISRFKYTAFCTLYSVLYCPFFISNPSTLTANDLRASSAAQSIII